jgi:hypothetical protein
MDKEKNVRKAATSESKVIEIPEIRRVRMQVTIEGVTPLICHRFGERAIEKMEAVQVHAAKLKKEPRDPEADFKDAMYHPNGDVNRHGFPAGGVKKALVCAGGRFADETMTVLRGVIQIPAFLLDIEAPYPEMRKDPTRLSNGAANLAYRPGYSPWKMKVPVEFNETMISQAQVLNLFQLAGFSIGLGDWRPEKNGTFGQFQIAGAEVVGEWK